MIILAYKKHHIKKVKGQPQWTGELTEIEKLKAENAELKEKIEILQLQLKIMKRELFNVIENKLDIE